jgi:hypothetical protein
MNVKGTIVSEELSEPFPAEVNKERVSSPSIVSFDNEVIKSRRSPVAFFASFLARQKGSRVSSSEGARRNLYFV